MSLIGPKVCIIIMLRIDLLLYGLKCYVILFLHRSLNPSFLSTYLPSYQAIRSVVHLPDQKQFQVIILFGFGLTFSESYTLKFHEEIEAATSYTT